MLLDSTILIPNFSFLEGAKYIERLFRVEFLKLEGGGSKVLRENRYIFKISTGAHAPVKLIRGVGPGLFPDPMRITKQN